MRFVLLCLLPAAASAQDATAPAVPAGLDMGEGLAAGGGIAALLALLVRLWPLLSQGISWLAARTQSEQLSHALLTIRSYAESSVGTLALKALDDGRIDAAEAAAITQAALQQLPTPVVDTAKKHFGEGFPTFLGGLVAGLIADEVRKAADRAGAVAAARIDSPDAAIAAEVARRGLAR